MSVIFIRIMPCEKRVNLSVSKPLTAEKMIEELGVTGMLQHMMPCI